MRIGLLGGCFNPVHNGHLRLALEAGEGLELDRVDLVPAGVPPHKPGEPMLPFELRAALCEAAVAGVPALGVDRLEGDSPEPSYTINTLARLRDERPADRFTFILGAEDLLLLPQWRRGLEIPTLADLAVAGRREDGLAAVRAFVQRTWPGAEPRSQTAWVLPGGRTLTWLSASRLDISASDIRARWLAGRSLLGLTPPAVERLLAANAEAARAAWAV